jgi:pantoate--beta-alanine ligase
VDLPFRVLLGLGSNLGDRERALRTALAALAERKDCRVVRVSSLRETDPVGGPPQPRYLNGAAELRTSLTPLLLLEVLEALQARAGRQPGGPRNAPRPLDLDILDFDRRRFVTPRLTVPHPRAHEREFVRTPLSELGAPFPWEPAPPSLCPMEFLDAVAPLRTWVQAARSRGLRIGFVPTMGALHDGHLSLVARSLAENHRTLVSVFVNPLQFAPGEDFTRYPRALERDQELLRVAGVDALFHPAPDAVYPPGFATRIDVGELATILEGKARPGHFLGVATVVLKLFCLVQPTRAYFGEKDLQQVAVIRRMVDDLQFPVEVVRCPTVRDPDGLALSSRNVYLSAEDRQHALALSRALFRARQVHQEGERHADRILAAALTVLRDGGITSLDYLELREDWTLRPAPDPVEDARVLVAARVGTTRLIDNLGLRPEPVAAATP